MRVYTITEGEVGEGGKLIGVYTDEQLARAAFAVAQTKLLERWGTIEFDPDIPEEDRVYEVRVGLYTGCDYLKFQTWHENGNQEATEEEFFYHP